MAARINTTQSYAVRSSANVEDGRDFSFAGQFATVLGASGIDAVIDGVETVYREVESPGTQSYLSRAGIPLSDVDMAVIVQEMVEPVVSGVAFSRNPVTGLDEIVVEAVTGSGEALVQTGVTPDRWVNKWGAWTVQPEKSDIARNVIEDVVGHTKHIAHAFGAPVDLEWVYDGTQVYWVQLREINELDDIHLYSNRISREMAPGLIKPLVWSVNIPLVNTAWVRLLTELIGPNDIDPNSLAKAFHFRTYFDMGTLGQIFATLGLPRESLELLMGLEGGPERPSFRPTRRTLRHVPRMLRFLVDKLTCGSRIARALPGIRQGYEAYATGNLDEMDDAELITRVEELIVFVQQVAYFNIVSSLLLSAYNGMLSRLLERYGIDPGTLDVVRGLEELEQYDPKPHLARLRERFLALDETTRTAILAGGDVTSLDHPTPDGLRSAASEFLDRFGHLGDSSNDFSLPAWREQPDLVLHMIATAQPPEGRSARVAWQSLPLSPLRRTLLGPLYRRTRDFHLYRETTGGLYAFGTGLFRTYFLAFGRRFADEGLLERADDVFFLDWDEVRVCAGGAAKKPLIDRVNDRRAAMEASRDVVLPETIYGDRAPPLDSAIEPGDLLRGIPTSPGYYRGQVRVIRSAREFDRLQPGEVLVIPYSDVSWTPLFAQAGAVVAESGGILAHSSIVAREYGLPCVVSVSNACQLPDGLGVTVDGYRGEILVHREEHE
jgi:pyruvate,water dikinase